MMGCVVLRNHKTIFTNAGRHVFLSFPIATIVAEVFILAPNAPGRTFTLKL